MPLPLVIMYRFCLSIIIIIIVVLSAVLSPALSIHSKLSGWLRLYYKICTLCSVCDKVECICSDWSNLQAFFHSFGSKDHMLLMCVCLKPPYCPDLSPGQLPKWLPSGRTSLRILVMHTLTHTRANAHTHSHNEWLHQWLGCGEWQKFWPMWLELCVLSDSRPNFVTNFEEGV